MTLQTFNCCLDSGDIVAVLMRDGGVIIKNQVNHALIDEIVRELRPHFDDQGNRFQNDFNGYKTLRLSGILGLSRTSAELIAHPLVMEVADAVLRPHCARRKTTI